MLRYLFVLALLGSSLGFAQSKFVGYVSDSGCARARSAAGKYTPTNPDCARKCVKEGKSIVLISPEKKEVFGIDNPAALRSQVGNKVEIYGEPTGTNRIRVDKVVFLEESNPECERPPLKN